MDIPARDERFRLEHIAESVGRARKPGPREPCLLPRCASSAECRPPNDTGRPAGDHGSSTCLPAAASSDKPPAYSEPSIGQAAGLLGAFEPGADRLVADVPAL